MGMAVDWLLDNKEWLLSGIAVAVPLAVIGWLFSRSLVRKHRQVQKGEHGSINVHAGRDIDLGQKAGDHSTNIQAHQITIAQGPTLSEVKEIALEVFKTNFYSLAGDAADIARGRAEEITDKFLHELTQQNEEGFRQAKDPDFQYALFTVQKEYARTGDKELGDLLVDLLVDRTKQGQRSILQIVLNESLNVAPKLTADQLAMLSVVFIIKHTKNQNLYSLQALSDFLDKFLQPFVGQLTKNAVSARHLEFCGCAAVPPLIGFNIAPHFLQLYPGLFSRGFEPEELVKRTIALPSDSDMFIRCLHNANKMQLNATDETVIRTKATERKVSEPDIEKLIALNKEFLMPHTEVKEYLIRTMPYMETLFDVWEGSLLQQVTLTSVGMAIGHANVKKNVGGFTDLSIWVN